MSPIIRAALSKVFSILGIGSVALTQVLIWAGIMITMSSLILPAIIPSEIMGEVTAFNSGSFNAASASNDIEMIQALSIIGNVGYVINLFIYLILFFYIFHFKSPLF